MSNLPHVPAAWEIAPLSAIADVNQRLFCPLAAAAEQPVHFVSMSAVTEEFGGIDVSARRRLGEVQKGYTAFLSDDVLFAKITPCMENGKLAVVPPLQDHIAYGSTEFHVLSAKDKVQPRWLAHFLSQSAFRRFARQNMTGSAGQMRVATAWLTETPIPVAPAAEQARIVAKLEELLSDLDSGVAELKAAQKKLAQYRQSLLKAAVEGALTAEWRAQNTPAESGAQLLERILVERRARWEAKQLAKFKEQGKAPPKEWQKKYPEPVQPDVTHLQELPAGWVWATIDCLLSKIETGNSFKCAERPPTGEEIGVVKVSAVSWGTYDEQESKTCVNSERVKSTLLVSEGDFLFSRANTVELVGACVIAKNVTLRVMLSDKILRLILVQDELKSWLLFILRSKIGRRQIESLATGNQESMKNIGQERLRSIAIPLGPKAEIDHSILLVDREFYLVDRQMSVVELALKQATAQRQNILRAAFAGQLVPQDPNDEPASALLARIRAERAASTKPSSPRKRRAPKSA